MLLVILLWRILTYVAPQALLPVPRWLQRRSLREPGLSPHKVVSSPFLMVSVEMTRKAWTPLLLGNSKLHLLLSSEVVAEKVSLKVRTSTPAQ